MKIKLILKNDFVSHILSESKSWTIDKNENKFISNFGRSGYIFKEWPPKEEDISLAELMIFKNDFEATKEDIDEQINEDKLTGFKVRMFAFLPPNKDGISYITKILVYFNIDGNIVKKVPATSILFPNITFQFSNIIRKYSKIFQRNNKKGYYRSDYFIRFGEWNSSSIFGLTTNNEDWDEWKEFGKNTEMGISVYNVRRSYDKWIVKDINREEAIYDVGNYWNHMIYVLKNRPIFLVRGTQITIKNSSDSNNLRKVVGSDGEPLLEPETIEKIKKLNPYKVYIIDTHSKSVGELWNSK